MPPRSHRFPTDLIKLYYWQNRFPRQWGHRFPTDLIKLYCNCMILLTSLAIVSPQI